MTVRLLTAWLLVAAGVGLAACGSEEQLPANAPAGQRVWVDADCGACHTLQAAGSNGTAGPNLDEVKPSAATVEHWVRDGGQGMPQFEKQLDDTQILEVSKWVAEVAGP